MGQHRMPIDQIVSTGPSTRDEAKIFFVVSVQDRTYTQLKNVVREARVSSVGTDELVEGFLGARVIIASKHPLPHRHHLRKHARRR
jgi:hypothetical protein